MDSNGPSLARPAVRFTDGAVVVEPLFDAQAQPLVLGTWLNQRLFRVDQRVYTLGDTLKFVANKEAVHVDIGRDEQSRTWSESTSPTPRIRT